MHTFILHCGSMVAILIIYRNYSITSEAFSDEDGNEALCSY